MPNLNVEKTTTLSNNLMTFLEKRFLDRLLVKFHFGDFGMKQKLRKGMGKVVEWVRYNNLNESVTPLVESESPNGLDISNNKIIATVAGYGQFAATSDFLVLTGITDIMKDYVDLLSYAAGKSLDALTRNEVDENGTNQFADGLANEAAVQADSSAVLDAAELRTAAKTLRTADVDEFADGMFRGIIHPIGEFDLLSETAAGSAVQTIQHTDDQIVRRGLIGSLYGVKLFRSSHVRTSDDASSDSNTSVYQHVVVGMNAYGTVDLEGAGLRILTKQLGSGGTEDPLDQRATVGYKFYYATKTLDANRIIVINAFGA